MIKIDKNIPITSGRNQHELPFRDMEIGDSFFVPVSTSVLSARTSYWRKKLKRKFTIRRWKENGVSGARAWRIE